MIVFPAIDILDGKAVRLLQGRLDAVTVYNDDPVDQAQQWIAQGAEWLHVVDLDGAVTGDPKNIDILERIVALGVPVQTGGGLRSMEVLERLEGVGVRRMVLGTALITQPALVTEAASGSVARSSPVSMHVTAKSRSTAGARVPSTACSNSSATSSCSACGGLRTRTSRKTACRPASTTVPTARSPGRSTSR
jgi:phosphoribosylformimino-5-aminoimidazole carboxamide ribonucleotide (ProFAR) isomerase